MSHLLYKRGITWEEYVSSVFYLNKDSKELS